MIQCFHNSRLLKLQGWHKETNTDSFYHQNWSPETETVSVKLGYMVSLTLIWKYQLNKNIKMNLINVFSGCEDKWITGPTGCYRLFSGSISRLNAENKCKSVNGNLVKIETQEENNFLSSILRIRKGNAIHIIYYIFSCFNICIRLSSHE